MFLSCSHFNVSPFALKVSATTGLFALECELRMAMFLRPRDYVLAPLQLRNDRAEAVVIGTVPVKTKAVGSRAGRLWNVDGTIDRAPSRSDPTPVVLENNLERSDVVIGVIDRRN